MRDAVVARRRPPTSEAYLVKTKYSEIAYPSPRENFEASGTQRKQEYTHARRY